MSTTTYLKLDETARDTLSELVRGLPDSLRGEIEDVTHEVEQAMKSRAGDLIFPDTAEGERPLHGEISKHPQLVSYLYDVNHLPEQTSREKTASSLKVMQAIALGYFLAKGIVPGQPAPEEKK